MEVYENEYLDGSSDFDDRLELEDCYSLEIEDESELVRDDDLFYRPLEEY